MSDRWYRDGMNPLEFDGAAFMAPVPGVEVAPMSYLLSQPAARTRFTELAEALRRDDLPYEHSLVLAKELQQTCGIFFSEGDELDNFMLAMQMIGNAEEDIVGGDYVVSTYGQHFIAKLGGYSLKLHNGPTITLRMYDPGVSARRTTLPRVLRSAEPRHVPVVNVDNVFPYEA